MIQRTAGDGRGLALLALETATSETIVAIQPHPSAAVVAERWAAGHAHGERLLASVDRVLAGAGIGLEDVGVIAVGTGPGSFTGLRIGLAAAKGLAFGLAIRIVGVPTPEVIARALGHADRVVVLQPAGPSGRYRTVVERDANGRWRAGPSEMVTEAEGTRGEADAAGETVAVDLPDANARAGELGRSAMAQLPEALVEAARERLDSRGPDDLAELVPSYVSPPRGAALTDASITWSRVRP